MTPQTILIAIATFCGPVVAVVITLIVQARSEKRSREFQRQLIVDMERDKQGFEKLLQEERLRFDKEREEERRRFDAQLEEEKRKLEMQRSEERAKFDQAWNRGELDRLDRMNANLRHLVRAIKPDFEFPAGI